VECDEHWRSWKELMEYQQHSIGSAQGDKPVVDEGERQVATHVGVSERELDLGRRMMQRRMPGGVAWKLSDFSPQAHGQ
jgi:hypothetical protein